LSYINTINNNILISVYFVIAILLYHVLYLIIIYICQIDQRFSHFLSIFRSSQVRIVSEGFNYKPSFAWTVEMKNCRYENWRM